MSINALGFGAPTAAAAPTMPIGDFTATNKPLSPAEAAKVRAQESEARQKATLNEIREKGLYEWAQETKFEKLKDKIREQLMAERGLDAASMTPEQQTSLEDEIARLMKEAMQEALSGEAQAAAAEGRPAKPMLIDISV